MVQHKTVLQPKWNLRTADSSHCGNLNINFNNIPTSMFLFCFFPLCKHTTPSAAVNVCRSPSKPSLNLLVLYNKVHMHTCTDSHMQQFLCVSQGAKERCTEMHQPSRQASHTTTLHLHVPACQKEADPWQSAGSQRSWAAAISVLPKDIGWSSSCPLDE